MELTFKKNKKSLQMAHSDNFSLKGSQGNLLQTLLLVNTPKEENKRFFTGRHEFENPEVLIKTAFVTFFYR